MMDAYANIVPATMPVTLPAGLRSGAEEDAQEKYWIDAADSIARKIAEGAVVAHAFANFYAITTRADAATVRSVNLMKGRPPAQVGSIVTTREHIPELFDWSKLPAGITRTSVMALIDALYALGPFGFRGPAAEHIPEHLSSFDDAVRTTQVIAPGYACSCNHFLEVALKASGATLLYVTSANRSHHQTGARDEPAHYLADALAADFAQA
ncbi:MAG: hypothetical protein LBF16_12140, partial [Pseudomonadales bacterium]|nr:hypothetical protein [Pseudomonadales bacterium]